MGIFNNLLGGLNTALTESNKKLEEYNRNAPLRLAAIEIESKARVAKAKEEFINTYGVEAYNAIGLEEEDNE